MSSHLSSVLKAAAPKRRSKLTLAVLAEHGRRRRHRHLVLSGAVVAVLLVMVGAGLIAARPDRQPTLRTFGQDDGTTHPTDTAGKANGRVAAPVVEPDTGLDIGQPVTVTTAASHGDVQLWATLCGTEELEQGRGAAACDLNRIYPSRKTDNGNTSITVYVPRVIDTAASGWVDCTSATGRCAIAIGKLPAPTASWRQITFAADPLPAGIPTIRVVGSPAPVGSVVTVHDDTVVKVAGSDFPADATIGVALCPPATSCGGATAPTKVIATNEGTFVAEIHLEKSVDLAGYHYSCATGCRISALTITPAPESGARLSQTIPVIVTNS